MRRQKGLDDAWISGARAKDQKLLDARYPKPKCPACGGSEYLVWSSWQPQFGMEPEMRRLRCQTETFRLTGEVDSDGFHGHRWQPCGCEYYISPALSNHGRKIGALL